MGERPVLEYFTRKAGSCQGRSDRFQIIRATCHECPRAFLLRTRARACATLYPWSSCKREQSNGGEYGRTFPHFYLFATKLWPTIEDTLPERASLTSAFSRFSFFSFPLPPPLFNTVSSLGIRNRPIIPAIRDYSPSRSIVFESPGTYTSIYINSLKLQ